MKNYIREPINAITHFFAAVLSVVGFVFLLHTLKDTFTVKKLVSIFAYSIGLIGLYSASAIYHGWLGEKELIKKLKRLDHMWIYILIAGSYTPICLITLTGWVGYGLLAIVWGLAITGVLLKKVWFDAPRWISTLFYLLLGWLAIFVIYPLYKSLPTEGIILLLAGGISYSVGALFYGFKPKKIRIWEFRYHEIFHIFTMLGSFCHFSMIYKFVLV